MSTWDLPSSIKLLHKTIKTANSRKKWKGIPANALYFTTLVTDLVTVVFALLEEIHYKEEVIITAEKNTQLWSLITYENYCRWHTGKTPWDFFPRHLSKKEFLNPYLTLEKFTKLHTLSEWKYMINDILIHALTTESISEFSDDECMLHTWIYLSKLLEATHLIEVHQSTPQPKPRPKWKSLPVTA